MDPYDVILHPIITEVSSRILEAENKIVFAVNLKASKEDIKRAVEELYEVTGEYDVVTLVGADDIEEFRDILKNKILKIKGVKSTVTSVVLKVHKGPRCNGDMQEQELPRKVLQEQPGSRKSKQ